jgi:hypothetical protein
MTCSHCQQFFARFRCSATTHGECDCPKCQGYCQCEEEIALREKDDLITKAEAAKKQWIRHLCDLIELRCWYEMSYRQWRESRKYATGLTRRRSTAHQRR